MTFKKRNHPRTEFQKGHGNLRKNPPKKMSISIMGKPNWKGDKVGYRALHNWIRSHKPKSMFCEKCGKVTDKIDASSINHTYERDISKWRWLCRGCHIQGDKN